MSIRARLYHEHNSGADPLEEDVYDGHNTVATYAHKSANRTRASVERHVADFHRFVHARLARSPFLRQAFMTELDRLDEIGCPPLSGHSRDRIEAFHQALPLSFSVYPVPLLPLNKPLAVIISR